MTRKHIFFVITLLAAFVILMVLIARIDIGATWAQLETIGVRGALLMLLDLALALLGPILAWHILMRAEGIPVRLATTITSGLMGFAVNLISPLMYFGGEGVRTLHISEITAVPRRRVLATIVAGEFQALTALSASIVAALIVVGVSHRSNALPLAWMVGGAAGLAAIVCALLCILLLDVRLTARVLGVPIRFGIFPRRLTALQESASDVEETVRSLLINHKRQFFTAQMLAFLSPLAQFVLPAIYFACLKTAGHGSPAPQFSQLAAIFILVQLLFMLPTTPAGLGVYEAGIIGIFSLLGWSVSEGAAYAILVRLDDVLFSLIGTAWIAHFGLMGVMKGAPDA